MKSTIRQRGTAATIASLLLLAGLTACSTDDTSTASDSSSSSVSSSSSASPSSSSSAATTTTASPSLETLVAEVTSKFTQATYADDETGSSLPYNIYLPDDYDPSKTYPVVLYIADSSLVGQDVTAPLSQYGALIWASDEQQATQESIVIVPEYPEVILDDHGSYTTTDYVEMTARLVEYIEDKYSVDTDRVYGTGQSMGAMTVMYLAAEHPDLFAAEMIVSGQWDPSTLANLADEKFVYFAAGGDENATGGQTDVEAILKDADVEYGTASVDATWSSEEIESTISSLLANGNDTNFATFTTGSVLEVSGSSSSSSMGSSEHMASFQPAYEIGAARDWLLKQTA